MEKTILIVDNEKDMSIMLKRYFELNGYMVQTVENGTQAIEKQGSSRISFCLTSICLILMVWKFAAVSVILCPVPSFF